MKNESVKRKILVFVITAAFILGLVSCKNTNDNMQDDNRITLPQMTMPQITTPVITLPVVTITTKPEETEAIDPFAEKMTITWLVGINSSHLYEEGRWDELELEKLFNVELKLWNVLVNPDDTEEIDMMLAAGDVPDYGFYFKDCVDLYEEGLTRSIAIRKMEEFYPSYYKKLVNDPYGYELNRVKNQKTEYYGFTSFSCLSTYAEQVPMWRLDWLQKAGYKLTNIVAFTPEAYPQYKNNVYFSNTKFTLEDVKEIYRAFTEDDPDGNGLDDTYGSVFTGTALDVYNTYAMFGYTENEDYFYMDPETKDYVPYFAYSAYRDCLKFLTEMLDRGFMRPLSGPKNVDELLNAWKSGKTGFMNAFSGASVLGYDERVTEKPPYSILQSQPEAVFVITPAPGVEGKLMPYRSFDWNPLYTYTVGAQVTDDKLERLMRILEYTYFGENWMRYKLGIEGVHYVWAGEPYKSAIILDKPENIPPKYSGLGTPVFGQFGNIDFVGDIKSYFEYDGFTTQFVNYFDHYNQGGYYDNSFWIRPGKYYSEYTMPSTLYDRFTAIKNDTYEDVMAVHSDFVKKVWAGEIIRMDNEWDEYIRQIYAAGLRSWVDIWNNKQIDTYDSTKE